MWSERFNHRHQDHILLKLEEAEGEQDMTRDHINQNFGQVILGLQILKPVRGFDSYFVVLCLGALVYWYVLKAEDNLNQNFGQVMLGFQI